MLQKVAVEAIDSSTTSESRRSALKGFDVDVIPKQKAQKEEVRQNAQLFGVKLDTMPKIDNIVSKISLVLLPTTNVQVTNQVSSLPKKVASANQILKRNKTKAKTLSRKDLNGEHGNIQNLPFKEPDIERSFEFDVPRRGMPFGLVNSSSSLSRTRQTGASKSAPHMNYKTKVESVTSTVNDIR